MGLIKRVGALSNNIVSQYADNFTGLGCISDVTHHIELKPDARPVVHPPRRVPVTLRLKVKAVLQRMEKLGVVERVSQAHRLGQLHGYDRQAQLQAH